MEEGAIKLVTEDQVYLKDQCLSDATKQLLGGCNSPDQAVASLATRPNPNLLDNWYFLNPVNQLGQTSFTKAENTIDRWWSNCWQGNPVELTGNGICTHKNGGLGQYFEAPFPAGQKLTASVLMADNVLCTTEITIPDVDGQVADFYAGAANFQVAQRMFLLYGVQPTNTFVAAKLEYGPCQTLAHKEGERWVLNEIPNYADQLARCRRYQFVIGSNGNSPIGTGHIIGDTALVSIPIPVELRTTPTIRSIGTLPIVRCAAYITSTSFSLNCCGVNNALVDLKSEEFASHNGEPFDAYLDLNSYLVLDANL